MLKKRLLRNQKGLSAVVSSLIIILLVLVAAGIIWVVVRGIVQEGAEGIELGKFTLDLEIKSAQIENGDVTVVVVRRNPGEGNYIGMNFIFSDGTNSEIKREDTILEELEERTFTFALTEIDTENLETISVAPIFELSSGKESTGNVADSLEVTEEMKAGITGGVINNFEALGFEGMGKVEYTASSSEENLPEFKRAIVDPLDVLPGDDQTFTVHVYSPYGITDVTSVTELDNSTLNLDFEKIDEYISEDETIEIWSVSWVVNDTHAIEYKTHVTATDSEENSNTITLTWTDSCQTLITQGQDITITQDCATVASAVGGLDGGTLTIQSGKYFTLNSGSKWAFNDGKAIKNEGTIMMGGGSIAKGNLFYTDADGDNYAASTTMTYSASSTLAGYISVSNPSLLGTNDCNEGSGTIWTYGYGYDGDNDNYGTSSYGCNNGADPYDATAGQDCMDSGTNSHLVWRNIASLGLDADHDRYYTGSAATRCVGAKSSYWYRQTDGVYKWISTSEDFGSNDCCDSDSDAWPTQGSWFQTQTNCGGWDYNCNTNTEERWPDEGQYWECYFEIGTCICGISWEGDTGWEGNVPNCGVPGVYITDPGEPCLQRSGCEMESECWEIGYMADWEGRTQECH